MANSGAQAISPVERDPLALSLAPAALLLALPWLNPFAPPPSPAVVPWLGTLACVAVLLLGWGGRPFAEPSLVARAWLTAALVSSGIALCQYFGVSHYFWPWMNAPQDIYANLRQRNQFASLASIGLLALRWHTTRDMPRSMAVAAAVVLGAVNALSGSRTGLLQLFLIALLTRAWDAAGLPHGRRILTWAGLAYVATSVLMLGWGTGHGGILYRFDGDGDGCGSRLILWRNVLELIAQRPWTGWGWGELDYAHFIHLYAGPRFCEILGNAHNLPLHLAVELGIPLAVLTCGALLWVLARARPWRERAATRQLGWGVLAVIGLHSLLEYPLWYGPFLLSVVLSVGLLVRADASAPAARWWPRAAGVLLLLAVAYAAWDYRRVSQLYLPIEQRVPAYREDTLAKVRDTWLFGDQVRFAELNLTPLTRANAPVVRELALALLHYSPEPRVVEKLIESDVLLGRDDEALFYLARYRAAFAAEHARWAASLRKKP